ncbi:M48 family metalloprotease [Micromonospora sp. WMMD987]|uniref:M48 family metalloprotease n=1 Tax=Micromonospora sp. WMMD987 TaxID=3016089 RepID=UPI00249CC33E|nr:M48 family metalloprotease [Micromonospora sp. WMMD987]WFE92888.1 M48 family metalloprotease [Micromonospora sp. WMMD987]
MTATDPAGASGAGSVDAGPVGAFRRDPAAVPERLGWWYLLVVAALGAVGVGAGDLYFLADRSRSLPWAVAFAACERASGATAANPVPPGFTDCLAAPARQRALVLLVAVAVVLAGAAVLLVAVPAADLWRLRRHRGRFTVEAAARRFGALCAAEQLTGRDRPRLLIAGPPVRQAFTVGLVGRRPTVVLPVGLAVAYRDPHRFDPVVRHELAHVRARDVTWVAAVRALVWLPLPAVAVGGLLEIGAFGPNAVVAGAFLRAGLLAGLVAVLAAALLRARERAADRYAAAGGPAGALTALLRSGVGVGVGVDRRSPALWRRLFARHPTAAERIRSLREPADRRAGELVQGVAVGAVAVVTMAAVHELVMNGHYPALGWLPRLVDVWVGAVLIVGGLLPSLRRRAATARRSGATVGWWRPVAGTGVGLFVATLGTAWLPLPGGADLFLDRGATASLAFAVVTAVLGAGAVGLCVLVAAALARSGARWWFAGYASALGVTVAVLWPVPGLPPLWHDPDLVRSWLAYDLPATGWLLPALGLPALLALRSLTGRRPTGGPPNGRRSAVTRVRRVARSTRVRVVAVAVLVCTGGAVGQLRLAPPGSLDEAVADAQARWLLTALAGGVVLLATATRPRSGTGAGTAAGSATDPGPAATASSPDTASGCGPAGSGPITWGMADRLGRALPAAVATTLGSALLQYLDAVLAGRSADGPAFRLTVGNPLVWLLYLTALGVPFLLLSRPGRVDRRRWPVPARSLPPVVALTTVTLTLLALGPGVPGTRVPLPAAGTPSVPRSQPTAAAPPALPTSPGGTPPGRPTAVGPASGTSSVPGRRLTTAEARAVSRAARSALPGSWVTRPVTPEGDDPIEPADCRPLARSGYLDRLRSGERARGEARYATPPGRLGIASTTVAVDVTSYAEPVPGAVFAAAEAARTACRRFTAGGVRFTVGGRPVPALGEQSWRVDYALAVGGGRSRITGASVLVLVRVGHNLVAVSVVAVAEPLDERLLADVVTTVVDALDRP